MLILTTYDRNSGLVVHLNYCVKIFWSWDVAGKNYTTDRAAGSLVYMVRSSRLGGVRIAEDTMHHLTRSVCEPEVYCFSIGDGDHTGYQKDHHLRHEEKMTAMQSRVDGDANAVFQVLHLLPPHSRSFLAVALSQFAILLWVRRRPFQTGLVALLP